jgi:threonine-phosphate decarboxylase
MTAVHGGDLTAIGRAFGRDPASLLDFSANINPFGPPAAVGTLLRAAADQPSLLGMYPDPHARELTAVLAARHAVAEHDIVVANGNAALLDVSVRALGVRRCVVPVPAFSEYARALAAAGAEMIPFALDADAGFALDPDGLIARVREVRADSCILCNPHNPTGRGEPGAVLAGLAAALERVSCATIVDEAFVDYALEFSVLDSGRPLGARTIVLRSLTKFYALPALRIGYGLAPVAIAERIRALLPSWPVGTLEQQAALAVLADAPYARETLRANASARAALVADLERLGARTFAPAANFVFCDVRRLAVDASALRAALIREHGIVVRSFDDPAYIRLAVRTPEENARLIGALSAYAANRQPEGVSP